MSMFETTRSGRKMVANKTTYLLSLYKVCNISVIVTAADIEPGASTLTAQTRYQTSFCLAMPCVDGSHLNTPTHSLASGNKNQSPCILRRKTCILSETDSTREARMLLGRCQHNCNGLSACQTSTFSQKGPVAIDLP